MSFLSRLFRSTRPASRRRSPARRRAQLGLESLEMRWTPAISIADQGTNDVTIEDSSVGAINNSIEIIDDFDTNTTYIRVNGGAETQLGASGQLLANLQINMADGKDKVTFSVRGAAGAYDGDLYRYIDLGTGDDVLTINTSTAYDLDGYLLRYVVDGDTTGNDRYTVAGGLAGGEFDFALMNESSGNDKYAFTLANIDSDVEFDVRDYLGNDTYSADLNAVGYFDDEALSLDLYDETGNDKYTIIAGGTNANESYLRAVDEGGNDSYKFTTTTTVNSYFEFLVDDSNGGKNSFEFRQGDLTNADMEFYLYFDDAVGAKNSAVFRGNAVLTDSSVRLEVEGGGLGSSYSFDDNVLLAGSGQVVDVRAGVGKDSFKVKLDGKPKSGLTAIADNSWLEIIANLDDGDDSFSASLSGSSWSVDSGGLGETGLYLVVNGQDGDDSLKFNTGSRPFAIFGDASYADLNFNGGDGDDRIKVDVGYVGGVGDPAEFFLNVDAGAGADRVDFGGYLRIDDQNLSLNVGVSLGEDLDKDTFKSTFRSSIYLASPVAAAFVGNITEVDAALDVVKLSTSSLAPVWIITNLPL